MRGGSESEGLVGLGFDHADDDAGDFMERNLGRFDFFTQGLGFGQGERFHFLIKRVTDSCKFAFGNKSQLGGSVCGFRKKGDDIARLKAGDSVAINPKGGTAGGDVKGVKVNLFS